MNQSKTRTLLTLAGVLTAVAVAAAPSFAHDRGYEGDGRHGRPFTVGQHQERVQKHEDVRAAITADDYAQFKELVGDRGPLSEITEEQFPKLTEVHEHLEAAKAIADELGLKGPMHGRMHQGK